MAQLPAYILTLFSGHVANETLVDFDAEMSLFGGIFKPEAHGERGTLIFSTFFREYPTNINITSPTLNK